MKMYRINNYAVYIINFFGNSRLSDRSFQEYKMSTFEPIRMKKGAETRRIENQSRDCLPDQFIREFVKNSIQAIKRAKITDGKISVDVDWIHWDLDDNNPTYLAFIDNGIGMSPSDMNDLINQLDSSSGISLPGENNYGVGAKISALVRNKMGIMFQSWQKNIGHQCLMKYNEELDAYGMHRFQLEDGTYSTTPQIENDFKPEEIADHGTKITLMGNKGDIDTCKRPDGVVGGATTWIYQYLNSRFFAIPENITLKVRNEYNFEIESAKFNPKTNRIKEDSDNKRNSRRIVYGHHETMLKHLLEDDDFGEKKLPNHGIVSLSDVSVHWYILNPERKPSYREMISGHTCIINEDEVFQLHSSAKSKAADFGLIFSKKDIALCFYTNETYSQDSSRRTIVKNIDGSGAEVPWSKWVHEFSDNIPKPLEVFENKAANKIEPGDSESIKEKIKKFAKFYSMSSFKKTYAGDIKVDDTFFETTSGHIRDGSGSVKDKSKSSGHSSGNINDIHNLFIKNSGDNAKQVRSINIPEFVWVSLENGREDGEMDDRAAKYNPMANKILGNRDFVVFNDIYKEILKKYQDHHESAAELIKKIVFEHYQFRLTELVVAALALKGRSKWNDAAYAKALSEEALTTGVLVRYQSIIEIERSVRIMLDVKKNDTPSLLQESK